MDPSDQVDSDDVLAEAEAAVETDPRNTDAWLTLSSVHFDAKRFASATVAAREAVRTAPGRSEGHRLLAEASILTSAPDSYAIAAAREAVRLEPVNPRCHATLGDVLRMAGRRGAAIRAFREASRLDPVDRDGVGSRASGLQIQIATTSLLIGLQLIAWSLLIVAYAQVVLARSNSSSAIAVIVTIGIVAALVARAVWRYRAAMSGSGRSLGEVLGADVLFAVSAVGTTIGLLLLTNTLFAPRETAAGMLGASASLLALALVVAGVRRVFT